MAKALGPARLHRALKEKAGLSHGRPVVRLKHVGGGWYELPDGNRVQGKEAAVMALVEVLAVED